MGKRKFPLTCNAVSPTTLATLTLGTSVTAFVMSSGLFKAANSIRLKTSAALWRNARGKEKKRRKKELNTGVYPGLKQVQCQCHVIQIPTVILTWDS